MAKKEANFDLYIYTIYLSKLAYKQIHKVATSLKLIML